jgi:hypothetical protein
LIAEFYNNLLVAKNLNFCPFMLFVLNAPNSPSMLSLKKVLNAVFKPKPALADGAAPYLAQPLNFFTAHSRNSTPPKQQLANYAGYGRAGAVTQTGDSASRVRFFFMLLSGGWGVVNFTGRATSGSFYPLLSRFVVYTGGSASGSSVPTSTYLFTSQFQ